MLKSRSINCDLEVGCDEVGRGCLAGPVVAAAVILPKDFQNELIKDSKLLNQKKRKEAEQLIKENALDYSIQLVDVEIIDKINILNSSILAMHKALDNLKIIPEHILIDGNRFKKYKNIPFQTVIKGDSKFLSIAAASILAKNFRNELMLNLSEEFPCYHWNKNFGYATKLHREAIQQYGICQHHRKSFKLFENQLELKFT